MRAFTTVRSTASRSRVCDPRRPSWPHSGTSRALGVAGRWSCSSRQSGSLNPQNAYGMSKLGQEMVAINLGRRYSIPTVALRYSIVQGPRQSVYNAYSGACRIFCLSYRNGVAPTLYEDGAGIRDYVNVDDVVDANLLVLARRSCNRACVQCGRRPRHDDRVSSPTS